MKEVVKDEGVTVESFAKQSLNQKESQSKVLGIKWDTGEDVMTIELSQIAEEKHTGRTLTKREILSLLSRIYDPLGVAGPVTNVARKIFQDICKDGTNWDSAISESEQKKWEKFVSNVLKNPEIMFPRCIVQSEKPEEMLLHTFADASGTAYCAAVYLVSKYQNGVTARLLTAKTRLPPLKKDI